jgi:hypothetical protein
MPLVRHKSRIPIPKRLPGRLPPRWLPLSLGSYGSMIGSLVVSTFSIYSCHIFPLVLCEIRCSKSKGVPADASISSIVRGVGNG